jgi:peroxiredoxin
MKGGMMKMTETIKVGDDVPNFTLKDQNKTEHQLSDLRGKKVLLSFHPLAWTGVCADQMRSLEANMGAFMDANTVPFGISVDSTATKLAWADDLGVEKLLMLSDFWPHGGYASKLGLFRDSAGITDRANVLVDEEGRVEWIKVYEISELPDIDEVLDQVGELRRKRE